MILFSCNSKNNNKLADEITISIKKDSTQILINGIDAFIIKELKSDTLSLLDLGNSISVYHKSQDEDLQDLEKPIEGNFQLQKSTIIFQPLKPLIKSETYIVELYLQHPQGDVIDKLKPSNSPFNQKPITKEVKF